MSETSPTTTTDNVRVRHYHDVRPDDRVRHHHQQPELFDSHRLNVIKGSPYERIKGLEKQVQSQQELLTDVFSESDVTHLIQLRLKDAEQLIAEKDKELKELREKMATTMKISVAQQERVTLLETTVEQLHSELGEKEQELAQVICEKMDLTESFQKSSQSTIEQRLYQLEQRMTHIEEGLRAESVHIVINRLSQVTCNSKSSKCNDNALH